MKRIVLTVLGLLAVAVVGGAAFVMTHEPAQRPLTDLRIEASPERVARGEYLVHHVSGCLHCHSPYDVTKRSHPLTGPEGSGGGCLDQAAGVPGVVCPPNITSDPETGLGAWTDDEILRAFREGVSRDGRALFPMMPYSEYRHMSDEDAQAIVAYLRTLGPVRRALPHQTKIDFPVSFFIDMEPKPLDGPVAGPSRQDPVAWGEYMATISGCKFCHEGGGGTEFQTPSGVVRTANLTPHETGVLPPTADGFIRLFHSYAEGLPDGVREEDFTAMAWRDYAGMTDDDLRAIHAYLQTWAPVDRQIQTYGEATSD